MGKLSIQLGGQAFHLATRRTMLPLVVLPSEDECVLVPDETLPDCPADVMRSSAEVIAFRVSVPNVKGRSGLHDRICCRINVPEELTEVLILHIIVLDS